MFIPILLNINVFKIKVESDNCYKYKFIEDDSTSSHSLLKRLFNTTSGIEDEDKKKFIEIILINNSLKHAVGEIREKIIS